MEKLILIILAMMFIAITELTAQTAGTIRGKVNISESSQSEYARIVIREYTTRSIIEEFNTGTDNSFIAHDLPFASYIIEVYDRENNLLTSRFVSVSSAIPVEVSLGQEGIYTTPEVVVLGEYAKDNTGGRTLYTSEVIRHMPELSAGRASENIIISSPGVVPDEDGRLHVRGEDAQLQYAIDGIPVTTNQTRVYSSLFNAGVIKSLDFLRGGLNPEFGIATSGVLNIVSRSGFDRPLFAHAYGQAGSFNSRDFGLEAGGNLGRKAGLFLAYSGFSTDRYLDPITLGEAYHDKGSSQSLFGKADCLIGSFLDAALIASYAKTDFSIPNGFGSSLQDQKHNLTNYTAGLRLTASLSDITVISLLAYARSDKSEAASGGLTRISSAADSVEALKNEKFFIGSNREIKTTGGMLEFSSRLAVDDNFKAGAGGESFPISEFFTFAVTNPALSNPDSSGGDARYAPYDITRGGKPFLVDNSMTGSRYFAYAREYFDYDNWHFSAGARYDHIKIFDPENDLSIKLGATYALRDNLLLRASYNRLIMMAPLENILVSSSDEALKLTGAVQKGIPNRVRSEKSHVFEIGGIFLPDRYLTLDLAGYAKLIDDFIVKVELGNSGIIFPANLRQGFVAGAEFQLILKDWNKFSGFVNLSTTASFGVIPSDGRSPVSAGLILGEEGQNYSHPFAGEDMFPTEHNQLITAAFNLTYSFTPWIFATLGGRFDSGLPFDLVDKDGKGLNADQARSELKRRGYSDEVIDLLSLEAEEPGSPDKSVAPHAIFDLSAGIDLRQAFGLPIRLSGVISNVFDTKYLYKFESSFGGTHFGTARSMSIKAEIFYN